MALDRLKHVRISGIACCVPENILNIDEFQEEKGSREIENFKKTTGIYQKHCCTKKHVITTGDLCYTASEKLITELNIERDSIDAVIFATQSADYPHPSTACILQYRLGLSQECLAYDINLGCSGYVYGLHIAASYMQSGHLKRVLLLTGDMGNYIDPAANLLFGEAGSATLIEYDEAQTEDMNFLLRTNGEGFKHLIAPYGGARHPDFLFYAELVKGEKPPRSFMDGAEIFNFSTRDVPTLIKDYLGAGGYQLEDFDVFAFHQANLLILQRIMKKLKLPKEKYPISLDIYGNTNGASIPMAICDHFNRLVPQDKSSELKRIIACGYGIGLSWGVTSFRIAGEHCFPIITTNEAFEDGIEL